MTKIYLNASNQRDNMYSYGGANEEEQMRKLAFEIKRQLDAYNCVSMVGTKSRIEDKAVEAAAWGADFSIALHSNAGSSTASGAVAFYGTKYPVAKALAEKLVRYVDEANPDEETHSRVVADNTWFDVWQFANRGVPSMLFEVTFHSNPEEAEWIVQHTVNIAAAIVRGIVEQFGLVKKDAAAVPVAQPTVPVPSVPAPSVAKVIYRVQVGNETVISSAIILEGQLAAAGYTTRLILDDPFFRVQVGAFAVKENADNLADSLRAKKYQVAIMTNEPKAIGLAEAQRIRKLEGGSASGGSVSAQPLSVGMKVKVSAGANDWLGNALASFVYSGVYDLQELQGYRAVIGIDGRVTAAVDVRKLYPAGAVSAPKVSTSVDIMIGNVVRIRSGARSYTGQVMDAWVFGETFEVTELRGDRAVLGKIRTAFKVSDLIRASKA